MVYIIIDSERVTPNSLACTLVILDLLWYAIDILISIDITKMHSVYRVGNIFRTGAANFYF